MLGFFKKKTEISFKHLDELHERVRILEHSIESLNIELLEIKKKARKKLYQEAIADIPKESENNINDDGFNFLRK